MPETARSDDYRDLPAAGPHKTGPHKKGPFSGFDSLNRFLLCKKPSRLVWIGPSNMRDPLPRIETIAFANTVNLMPSQDKLLRRHSGGG